VRLNPVAEALATLTVPAKPAIPLIAVVRFAAVYGSPVPPTSTESFPPMRTLNGEKYVAEPPPELACWLAIVYWNVVGLGTAVIVYVPL
jgi:hypothetical protein